MSSTSTHNNPRFRAGEGIPLSEMRRLWETAVRADTHDVTGANAETGTGGLRVAAQPDRWVFIRIVEGSPASSGQPPAFYYSFVEHVGVAVDLTNPSGGVPTGDLDAGFEGTYDTLPAVEVNGNTNVPADIVVMAWISDAGDALLFSYPDPGAAGSTTFTGSTTFNGATIYGDSGSSATISGDTDDYALPAYPVAYLNVTSPAQLTGLVAGTDGQRLVFINDGNAILTLPNESTDSVAANRLRTPYATRADVLLPPNFAVEFQYDATISRWRILWVSAVHLHGYLPDGTFSSDLDDYAIDQRYPLQVWTLGANINLTGLANGKKGQWYHICLDSGGYSLTIKYQDGASTAGNLINTPNETDYVVPSSGGFSLFYDGTYWNVIAAPHGTRPRITTITDANIILPAPIGPQEFAMLGVPLTAVRTVTLPAASDSPAGTVVSVVDKAGSVGGTNYLNVIRDGSDTINGATSYAMQTPYSKLDFVSDGASKWTVNAGGSISTPVSIANGGTGQTTAPAALDALSECSPVPLASAATTNIGASAGHYLEITGTTTITAFDTVDRGIERTLIFSDALTLTYNAVTLLLPGGANITTATGDTAGFTSLGGGAWRCDWYTRAAIAPGSVADGSVTFAKMQAVSANILLGNDATGTTVEEISCTAAGRALLDDADAAAQRTTLGLGSIATQAASSVSITGGSVTGITDLAIADGGTGASTAATAFDNLKQAASETATGVVELATTTEAQTGTDTTRVVTPAGLRAATRERLTADRTYYVRTDGSDSNDGLTNSSGGAFLTIQAAVDATNLLDLAGYDVTISVGSGTFTSAVALKQVFGGSASIVGAGLASTTISTTSVDAVTASGNVTDWTITDLKIQTTTSGSCLAVLYHSVVTVRNVAFGACANTQVSARADGVVKLDGSYTINGGALWHIRAAAKGTIEYTAAGTVTLSGTPAFTTAFAAADRSSLITTTATPTYSGAATGARYTSTLNSVIYTSAGGATFFPGNSAGSTATGGQYS